MLKDAIKRNRIRQARFKRAEITLRKIRQRIFDYEDESPEKYQQAQRVMATCQRILAPKWEQECRNRQAAILERTPSAFEPGCCG